MPLSGNQKIIKFLYFLSIIRWYNVLLMVLGQYFLALFVFAPEYSFHQIIFDKKLHLMVLSTIFTLAGAFVINAFYDADKDLVNRPKSALVGRVIGSTFLANSYIVFNFLALFFAFFATKKILIFYFLYIVICWFYSHKLQKKPIVRELSASLLTMAPLIAIWIHYGVWDWKLMYFFCTFLTLLFTKDAFLTSQRSYSSGGRYSTQDHRGASCSYRSRSVWISLVLYLEFRCSQSVLCKVRVCRLGYS